MNSMRIGQGFDVHAFQDGGTLVLGGVQVPYPKSLKAHSDGDVVIHALCDALLGAAGLGDIGQHFPDTDAKYRGMDSRILLRQVVALLEGQFVVANVDITIVAQAPLLAAHTPAMRLLLAKDLLVNEALVNLKATTTEHLGFIGRGEGIAAFAVCLLLAT